MKVGLPVSLILIGGASWWLAGLAMQPIYQFYRQIQQFTADAAHELRTPLTAARATVESALRRRSPVPGIRSRVHPSLDPLELRREN